ncbi:Mbov_0401 family ICE element transposase-like protein [Metamycoplasma equirhinis]|uniref:Mbov_0401 family ICE element transposase-like protein n=1 Tax=Metamycoplasma equirhinis TaxID=92402 RepID=UPI00359380EE
MTTDLFVNGVSEKDILSTGQMIIEKLNDEEEIFRTKTRLENEEYKDWIVSDRRIKTIIIDGEIYTINLTQYLDKKTGKKFTYYHNEILKLMGKKRYWLGSVLVAIKSQNLRRRNKEQNEALKSKIPYDIYHYYLKIKYITFMVQYDKFLIQKYQTIQIENDDAFIHLNNGKYRVRMVGIHNGYQDKNNHKLLNKTIIFQFDKNALTYQNMDFLTNKTKEIIDKFYTYKNINLSGDGARCITKFSQNIKAIRHYDKFHFHKILFNCFGYSKNKNRQNKNIFGGEFGNQFPLFLWFLQNKKYDEFENLLRKNIDFLKKNKISKLKIWEIKSLLRLWKNNKNYLINTYENANYFGGNAETFIGHYLKKYTKNAFSRQNINLLKLKILLNIPKNINVIFL